MPELILRPAGIASSKFWSLQLRYNSCGPTEYQTIAYLTDDDARAAASATNSPTWLYGEPASIIAAQG